jgi:hypothetical protein
MLQALIGRQVRVGYGLLGSARGELIEADNVWVKLKTGNYIVFINIEAIKWIAVKGSIA